MQEEEEKQRNSEMERRKMGQEILKSKKEREEQELKRIADEKRKEKMEDQLAKQKIIERIQQDRYFLKFNNVFNNFKARIKHIKKNSIAKKMNEKMNCVSDHSILYINLKNQLYSNQ